MTTLRRRIAAKPFSPQTAATHEQPAGATPSSTEAEAFNLAWYTARAQRAALQHNEQKANSLAIYKAISESDTSTAHQLMAAGETATTPIPTTKVITRLFAGEVITITNPTPLHVVVELTKGRVRNYLIDQLLHFKADPTAAAKIGFQSTSAPISTECHYTPAEALARKDLIVGTDISVQAAHLFFAEAEKLIIDNAPDEKIAAVIEKAKHAHAAGVIKYFDMLFAAEKENRHFSGIQHQLNKSQVGRLIELVAPYTQYKIKLGM